MFIHVQLSNKPDFTSFTFMSLPRPSSLSYIVFYLETTGFSKQPIRTRYLGHVTGYQPIREQYSYLVGGHEGTGLSDGHEVVSGDHVRISRADEPSRHSLGSDSVLGG